MPEIVSNGVPTGVKSEDVRRAFISDEIWEMWILWGQSQMSGTVSGDLTPGGPDLGVPSIYTLDQSGALIPEQYPMHTPPTNSPGGRSPGHSFAQLRAAAGANLILVPAAEGGVGIEPVSGGQWYGPASAGGSGAGGTHWLSVTNRINAFRAANPNIKFIIKGDIFAGGENEAFNNIPGPTFTQWYDSAVNGWKAALPTGAAGDHSGWVSVICDILEFLKQNGYTNTLSSFFVPPANFQSIAAEFRKIVLARRNVALVPTTGVAVAEEGLPGNDGNIHYSAAGTLEMGRRIYAAAIRAELNNTGSAKGTRADIQTYVDGTVYPLDECVYFPVEKLIRKARVQTSSTYIPSEWQDLTSPGTSQVKVGDVRATDRYGLGINLGPWSDGNVTAYAYADLSKAARKFTYTGPGTPIEDANGYPDLLAGQTAISYLFDTFGTAGVNSTSTVGAPPGSVPYLAGFSPISIFKAGVYYVEVSFDPAKPYAGFTFQATGSSVSSFTKIQSASLSNGYKDIWTFTVTTPSSVIQMRLAGPAKLVRWRIYHQSNKATVDSDPWNAAFLEHLSAYSVVRFMMTQNANGDGGQGAPTIYGVSDRPKISDATWGYRGIPLEAMCDLCSRIGADVWYCVPYRVWNDAAYAQLDWEDIDKKLAAGLRVYVEYSNEPWHDIVVGWRTFVSQLAFDLGYSGSTAPNYGESAYKAMAQAANRYWEHLAAAAGSKEKAYRRIVRTYGTQLANPGISSWILNTTFVIGDAAGLSATSVCDRLAVAPYFPSIPSFDPANPGAGGLDLSQFGLAKGFGVFGVNAWLNLVYEGTITPPLTSPNGVNLRAQQAAAKALIDAHVAHIDANFPGVRLVAYEGGSQVETNKNYEYSFTNFADTSQMEAMCRINGDPRSGELLEDLVRHFHAKTGGGLYCHFLGFDLPTIAGAGSPARGHFTMRHWEEKEVPTASTSTVYVSSNRHTLLRTRSRRAPNPAPYIKFNPQASPTLPVGLLPGQYIQSTTEGSISGRRFYPGQVLRNDFSNPSDVDVPFLVPIDGGDDYLTFVLKQQTVLIGAGPATEDIRQQFSVGRISKLDQTANSPLDLGAFGVPLYGVYIQHQEAGAKAASRIFAGRDNAAGNVTGRANAPCAAFQVNGATGVFTDKSAALTASLDASTGDPLFLAGAIGGASTTVGAVASSLSMTKDVLAVTQFVVESAGITMPWGMEVNGSNYANGTRVGGKDKLMLRQRSLNPTSINAANTTATASVLEILSSGMTYFQQTGGVGDTASAGKLWALLQEGSGTVQHMRRTDGTMVKITVNNSNQLVVALA